MAERVELIVCHAAHAVPVQHHHAVVPKANYNDPVVLLEPPQLDEDQRRMVRLDARADFVAVLEPLAGELRVRALRSTEASVVVDEVAQLVWVGPRICRGRKPPVVQKDSDEGQERGPQGDSEAERVRVNARSS